MALIIRTWPEYTKDFKRAGTRWRLEKDSKSPFIYVRNQKARKRISCQPLIHSNEEDIQKVVQAIIETGDN